MAEAKDSPGVSRSLEHWYQYPFFTPPANVAYALFVDVDRPGAVVEIFERIPAAIAPSWVIETPSGGAQAGWFIDPVDLRENARDHPIRYARNVGKALREVIGGDPLVDPVSPSRVRNPAYEHAGTFARSISPIYTLGDLYAGLKAAGLWTYEPMQFSSGKPVMEPTTGNLPVGDRNKGVFDTARFVAYDGGDYAAAAWAANDRCVIPLKANEVHTIINSIARFMATKGYLRTNGPTTDMPEGMRRVLSEMGRRGGLANTPAQRAARAKGPAAAAAARTHRAKQHAKHAQHLRRKGLSRTQIAAKLGKHPSTISRYLRRWIPIPLHEMLTCITGASGGVSHPALTRSTHHSHAIQLNRTLHSSNDPAHHNKSHPPMCSYLCSPPVGTLLRSTASSFVVGRTARNIHKPWLP
ncbi:replication initiation protein [Enteractinococcus coprophilus]|uniref:replication initiation protein n=1 Tax=Enteractinococcus coprophilus TaxID=1027633 RepID=UPI00364A4E62